MLAVFPRRDRVEKRKLEEPKKVARKPPPAKKLRSDCAKCVIRKSKISSLNDDIDVYKSQLCQKQDELDAVYEDLRRSNSIISQLKTDCQATFNELSKDYKVKSVQCKRLNEKVKRKTKIEVRLRCERTNFKQQVARRRKDAFQSSRLLKNERIRGTARNKRIEKLLKCIEDKDKEISRLSEELKDVNLYCDYLSEDREEECDFGEESEDDEKPVVGRYNSKIRKVMYQSLQSKVPLAHAEELVRYALREIGSTECPRLPSKSTISRMTYEIDVLLALQAAEAIISCDAATLCWDATSIDSQHINEIHVATPVQTFTLSIAALPGGTALDYIEHVTSTVKRMAHLYASYTMTDEADVMSQLCERFTSTLSDR